MVRPRKLGKEQNALFSVPDSLFSETEKYDIIAERLVAALRPCLELLP